MADQQNEKVHTADVFVEQNYLFSKFLLSDKLLKSLNEMNYIRPSPIQLKIIPLARSRLDMIIQSKSGTGKTLCFSICLLETYDEDLQFPQAIIIVPAREIAVQITNTLEGLGKHMKYFKACEFIGGTDLKNDRKRIQTAKIVVGTPGRILHLIKNAIFNISNIKAIVLDEADKLLESGQMAKDVQTILQIVRENENLQVMAATATVTSSFESQIKKFMKNPIGITPKHEAPVLLGIKQFVLQLKEEKDNIEMMRNKVAELERIFTKLTFKQCLLFTDSQLKTESYGNYLKKLGWKNEVINGSQEQAKRLKVLDKLTKFKCRLLITTDLMARGIDIEHVNLVINLDLPYDCFTYLHRIGRAGRFGTHGLAITFLSSLKERETFKKILAEIGNNKSMVHEFPDEKICYNFWDFNNSEQDEKLKKFDNQEINENDSHENENSALEEIERKLLNGSNGINSDNYKDKNLFEDYESSQKSLPNEKSNISEDDIISQNIFLLEISKKLIDQNETNNPNEIFDTSALLEDYEKCLQNENFMSEKLNQDETSNPKSLEEKKEFRQVIFNRKVTDDDYEESELSDSEIEEDDNDYESNDDDENDENVQDQETQPKIKSNTNQFQHHQQQDSIYESYNQYVASHYNQWRNTFYFQLANIQNYVNHNRSNFLHE